MDLIFCLIWIVANLLLLLVVILLLPVLIPFLWIKRYLRALFPKIKAKPGSVLIHAASVGEIMAIKPLIYSLLDKYPDLTITLSTTTQTGLSVARSIDDRIVAFLSPLDLLPLRLYQFHRLRPKLLCIVETEIWPNMLKTAEIYKCPVVFLNARMKEGTYRKFMEYRPLLRYISRSVVGVVSQSLADSQRFKELFTCEVVTTGNLKYAVKLREYEKKTLRKDLGYAEDDLIITWGSSRPGEEQIALDLIDTLSSRFPSVKLIIAPRHMNRVAEVIQVFSTKKTALYSKDRELSDVLIVDQLGVLDKCYAISDIAIVGGSFIDFGGHNPLEPAFYSKPIIMGRYYSSCAESVETLKAESAIIISEGAELADQIIALLHDPEEMNRMGRSAKRVLDDKSRSLADHLRFLEQWLS